MCIRDRREDVQVYRSPSSEFDGVLGGEMWSERWEEEMYV